VNEDDLRALAEIILNVWAGGEPTGDDFADREDEPGRWVYYDSLAVNNMEVIEELAMKGGLENLLAEHLQRKGGIWTPTM